MTKPRAIASKNDTSKPSKQHVAPFNNLLYLSECLSKDYTHKNRFMTTYESKVKGPIVEQGSCFLHVVHKPAHSLAP